MRYFEFWSLKKTSRHQNAETIIVWCQAIKGVSSCFKGALLGLAAGRVERVVEGSCWVNTPATSLAAALLIIEPRRLPLSGCALLKLRQSALWEWTRRLQSEWGTSSLLPLTAWQQLLISGPGAVRGTEARPNSGDFEPLMTTIRTLVTEPAPVERWALEGRQGSSVL